jgi:hypothetical protein
VKIPYGYILTISDPDGRNVDQLDLGGYNLDAGLARTDLVSQIADSVRIHERNRQDRRAEDLIDESAR